MFSNFSNFGNFHTLRWELFCPPFLPSFYPSASSNSEKGGNGNASSAPPPWKRPCTRYYSFILHRGLFRINVEGPKDLRPFSEMMILVMYIYNMSKNYCPNLHTKLQCRHRARTYSMSCLIYRLPRKALCCCRMVRGLWVYPPRQARRAPGREAGGKPGN